MITKKCISCEKEFQTENETEEVCSRECRHREKSRLHQKGYYQKVKDTPEYKEKRKTYFRKWLEKAGNREHFNDLCRDRSRQINARRREEWRQKEVCGHCGSDRDVPDRKSCAKCLARFRQYGINKKEKEQALKAAEIERRLANADNAINTEQQKQEQMQQTQPIQPTDVSNTMKGGNEQ